MGPVRKPDGGGQLDRDGGGLESAGVGKAAAGIGDGGKRGGDDGGCTRGGIPCCNVKWRSFPGFCSVYR